MTRLCRAVFATALLLIISVGLIAKAQLRIVEAHIALSESSLQTGSQSHSDHSDDHDGADHDSADNGHGHSHPAGFPPHNHDGHTHVALQFQMADVISKSEPLKQSTTEDLNRYSLPTASRAAGDSYVIELIRPPIA